MPHELNVPDVLSVASSDQGAVLPQWLVIDGQQRLTTCTVLLIALRDRLQGIQDVPIADSAQAIEQQFLRNPFATGLHRNRLALRGADDACLTALLDGTPLPAGTPSRVAANAAFFSEALVEVDPAQLLRGLRRLSVVAVTLSPKYDNPQLIFESLNSTGMALTQSDLVRNYVLMGHPEKRQTQWYEHYWRPLESAFGIHYRGFFDTFLRDFLAVERRLATPPRLDHVYREFRSWYPARIEDEQAEYDAREKLKELLRFGQHYCTFMFEPNRAPVAETQLRRLNKLVDVAAPTVMVLLDEWSHSKTVSDDELVSALELLESYVLRRSMVSADTRSGGKIFTAMAQKIPGERPAARLAALLSRMPKGAEFPSDTSFVTALRTQDVYGRRNLKFMLDRLTNQGKEKVFTENLTIEHILPQQDVLAVEWQEMLGPDWRSVRDAVLHKLGNLTLTGFNSELQARPFADKKSAPEWGYAASAVWLSRDIAKEATWGESQISQRSERLAQMATEIWKPLSTDAGVVKQLELEDARAKSEGHSVDALKWTANAKSWFNELRAVTMACGEDVTELPRAKSVLYYATDWFVEALPRAKGITLRLAADAEDLMSISPNVQDASAWQFVLNSAVSGGSLFDVRSDADLPAAKALVKRTYELTAGEL